VRVAFVAPFFGARAAGGAEAECRKTALRLAAAGVQVEIFTTCALDLHHEWNVRFHRAGSRVEDGLAVRRFPAEGRELGSFNALNARLMAGRRLSPREETGFMAMHVNSLDLCRALADARRAYDWICFIPYLFGTTVFGSRVCPDNAILIPCLHDEGYAHMRIVADTFRRARRVVFHTRAEQELAARLYGLPAERSLLVGEGIDTDFTADGDRFRRKYGIPGPFLFYAGRKDETKNVPLLLRYFLAFRRRNFVDLRLVLAGPGGVAVPRTEKGAIVDLGYVPEQDKRDAHAAALAFCQPSLNESFSIVIMESWLCGVPCLVHAGCAVTREHAARSGGGLYFGSFAEFDKCVAYLLANPGIARRMGAAGRRYVRANYAWDRIVERYRTEVFATSSPAADPP